MNKFLRSALGILLSGALLAGCTSLPSDTEPQALRPFSPGEPVDAEIQPTPGAEPDLLLRDFFTASARPSMDYEAARSFLAEEANQVWNPQASTLIVDRVDLITQAGATAAERTFAVRGNVIGQLAEGGAYQVENGVYEAQIEMEKEDGEWRISSLPEGVVLERTELRNQYEPHNLYFFEPGGRLLVSDRRWVYAGQETLDSVLISLMMEGPGANIAPAVDFSLPAEAVFSGVQDGIYKFSGLAGLDTSERQSFAAQLVWTLAMANIPGPYAVEVDGLPISENFPVLSTDDFAEFNPRANVGTPAPLYALNEGRLLRVGANQANPVEGDLREISDIESADITSDRTGAVVRRRGDESVLALGGVNEPLGEVLRADSISRPSFEPDHAAVWVAVDGNRVTRVVRSTATGEVVQSEVDTSFLNEMDGEISVLRLSRDGARVAMIIGGRVYTGVVNRPGTGQRRIVNVQEMAPQLAGSALALDWQPDGSLLVGTSSPESPIWRVEKDGSAVASLPSGNITAPVVAVAASSSTLYVTDARAVLQMPVNGGDSAFWREVPGLQGMRSSPVVAN
ncbi:Lipoprotein LpqB precursor [Corynebacterium occultum]|uniref:Lipoprotein LpqB n=1 Tax=Corynebacterium occultum TaxID=2675219 RepID=A0A6B8W2B9_9CORY|nr:MtrAB system accessory lipoprotein LpqB [Corynebacterium occultum]QGU06631.1 Lipoprotein LpqB precursor [Corynebacterium occultum]